MNINIQKFNEVAKAAKAKTNDKRWQAAIDKACAGVTSGWWVITELADGVMVTTECGATYHANGSCQCEAFKRNQPCKHRALARLLDIYESQAKERQRSVGGTGKKSVTEKIPEAVKGDARDHAAKAVGASVADEVETAFAAKFPGYHIADYLLKYYGQNSMRFMNRQLVADIHALILAA